MCYVQSLPDVWKPNIKAKKEFGPSSVSIMPEVDFTSTPGAWSASVSRQRCKALASSKILPSKTYPAVPFRV